MNATNADTIVANDDPRRWADGRLWSELKASAADRYQRIRNAIAERNMKLVHNASNALHARLPQFVDRGDLVSAGFFGLLDAIDGYDPGRRIYFSTYAPPRIRGAMLDHIRDADPVPRLTRIRQAAMERLRSKYRNVHGRDPEPAEVGAELGLSAGEVDMLIRGARTRLFVSINAPVADRNELSGGQGGSDGQVTRRLVTLLADRHAEDPTEEPERRDWWLSMCDGLDRSDRLIVTLYYREGLSMKEIGGALGYAESRVSQRHAAILAQLKAKLTRAAAA